MEGELDLDAMVSAGVVWNAGCVGDALTTVNEKHGLGRHEIGRTGGW